MNTQTLIASLAMMVATTLLAAGASLQSQSRVPGGVALLPIPDEAGANAIPPVATYDGKRVMVWKSANHWVAVVGIPLSAEPGTATLTVQPSGAAEAQIGFQAAISVRNRLVQSYTDIMNMQV